MISIGILFIHDKASPRAVEKNKELLAQIKWEVFDYPSTVLT